MTMDTDVLEHENAIYQNSSATKESISNTSTSKGGTLKYNGFGYGSNWSTKVPASVDESTTTQRVSSRQQVWGVFVSATVASLPAFLVGCTLGFSSSALLDLTDLERRPEYKFTITLSDTFGVSCLP